MTIFYGEMSGAFSSPRFADHQVIISCSCDVGQRHVTVEFFPPVGLASLSFFSRSSLFLYKQCPAQECMFYGVGRAQKSSSRRNRSSETEEKSTGERETEARCAMTVRIWPERKTWDRSKRLPPSISTERTMDYLNFFAAIHWFPARYGCALIIWLSINNPFQAVRQLREME